MIPPAIMPTQPVNRADDCICPILASSTANTSFKYEGMSVTSVTQPMFVPNCTPPNNHMFRLLASCPT